MNPEMPDGQDPEWVELYRAAVLELDHQELPRKVDLAWDAVQKRLQQIPRAGNHFRERQALEDAMNNLRSLRQQIVRERT